MSVVVGLAHILLLFLFTYVYKWCILIVGKKLRTMGNHKKDVREILLSLNNVSLQHENKYSYNVIYEYKYNPFFYDITVERKVVVFSVRTPVLTRHCKSDEEIIIFLLEELQKFENGSIDYKIKTKKKKGRKPKQKGE